MNKGRKTSGKQKGNQTEQGTSQPAGKKTMADSPSGEQTTQSTGTFNVAFRQACDTLYGPSGQHCDYPTQVLPSHHMPYYNTPAHQIQPQQTVMNNNNGTIRGAPHGGYVQNAPPSSTQATPLNIQPSFPPGAMYLEGQGPNIVGMLQQMSRQFDSRFSNIEQSLTKLTGMETDIAHLRVDVSGLKSDNKQITKQMIELEKSAQATSDICDDYLDNKTTTSEDIRDMRAKITRLEDHTNKLHYENNEIKEKCLETECRMMEQNLLFFGIAEAADARDSPREDTESVLRDFIGNKLVLKGDTRPDDIIFARVHRLGRRRFDNSGKQLRPRPIVAKFDRISQRETVKLSASSLTNSSYSIREQFPIEIEDRRKPLYHVMKRAKDEGNSAHFVRDKLFVNGRLVSRDHTHINNSSTQQPMYNRERDTVFPPRHANRSHTCRGGPPGSPLNSPTRTSMRNTSAKYRTDDPTGPRGTRFWCMKDGDPMPTDSPDLGGNVRSKKNKSVSPLEEQATKKSRDEHSEQDFQLIKRNISREVTQLSTSNAQTPVPATGTHSSAINHSGGAEGGSLLTLSPSRK
jgi:hypothetical protein